MTLQEAALRHRWSDLEEIDRLISEDALPVARISSDPVTPIRTTCGVPSVPFRGIDTSAVTGAWGDPSYFYCAVEFFPPLSVETDLREAAIVLLKEAPETKMPSK